jgi:hypothetical protein
MVKCNSIINVVLTIATIITAIPQDVWDVVPSRYKPWAAMVTGGLYWVNSHRNLFVNPNGTPAEQAWAPDNNPAPKP